MKFQKFILTMATLLITGSAVAAGFDSGTTPVFTPGSSVDLQIHADLPPGTSALQFTVTLPESFELCSESPMLNAQLASKSHNEGNGVYNYVLYTEDNSTIKADADWLFGLSLKAKSSAGKGVYALKFTNIISATASGMETHIANCDVALTVKIPVSQVMVIPSTGSVLIGGSMQLTAQVFPSDAEQGIRWESDNPDIASVDANGNVRGASVGNARITARSTDNTEIFGFCDVTVNPVMVEAVSLDKVSLELRAGASAKLKATVTPADATNSKVTWSSSDRRIADVDDNGTVTAINAGDVTITATATDGTNLSATCKVTVLPPLAAAVTLNKSDLSLTVKEMFTLIASVTPSDAEQKVTWSSSDVKIATVDAHGEVNAVASGSAVITATAADGSGVSGSCTVTVTDAKVSSITLSKTVLGLRIGQSETITATVLPEYAANRNVIWSSGDKEVADVDADGKVTAVSLGEAVITATAADGSGVLATCAVTVTNALATGISIDRSTATLYVDQLLKLTATVTPEGAVGSVNWSSDVPEVAKVDKDGNVKALSPGSAIITAATADGTNLTATCMITVEPVKPESVTFSVSSWIGKVGEGVTLTATVLPENTTDKTLTWSSSNPDIASVDANGNVTALNIGTAVITAVCDNVSAKCDVTVVATMVESLTVSPEVWDGMEGMRFSITATVLPEDATDKSLDWSSSDPDVAYVDQEGNVSLLKEGNCVIRAATLDGSNLYAECVVTSWSGIEEIFTDPDERIDIYSTSGQLLNHKCTLEDVKHLESGLYVIRSCRVTKTILIRK